MIDQSFLNILILSLSFLFILSSFNCGSYIQKVIVDSINNEQPNLKWNPYLSLCIVYGIYSFSNFLAPSIHQLLNYKLCLFLASITYLNYMLIFFYPLKYSLYFGSILVGLGAGIFWTTQCKILTENSTLANLDRNTAIFWSIHQLNLIIGNLYYYFEFQDVVVIRQEERIKIYLVLSLICFLGCITILFLRNNKEIDNNSKTFIGPYAAFKNCFTLFKTKECILISISSLYTGLELSFFESIYATVIAFTKNFGIDSKKYTGLYGVFNGLGAITGAILFDLILKRFIKKNKSHIYLIGFLAHILSFIFIFLNHSNISTYMETEEYAYLKPRLWISLLNGFLLCIGDSCFNTQLISLIGSSFKDQNQSGAFAIYNFFQAFGSSISFFYSSYDLTLNCHLIVLIVFAILGYLSFYLAEKSIIKNKLSLQ